VGFGWFLFHDKHVEPYLLPLSFLACVPLIFSVGYIRLVSCMCCPVHYRSDVPKRIVVMKDQHNKASHEDSAKLACEAAGAIRTVSSLTREADCLRLYSNSLEEPLRRSNRTSPWSCLIYAFSQSSTFWSIALVFWYGSTLVSTFEITATAFFTALMVRILSTWWLSGLLDCDLI